MDPTLSFLHLSDLHRGVRGEDGRWPQLREPFLAELERLVEEQGPPDLILFTGDLAFSGRSEEYRRVDETLRDVCDALGSDPLVVPVPGNHDLARIDPAAPIVQSLARYHETESTRRAFLQASDGYVEPLERAFADYREWWSRRVLPQWRERSLVYRLGMLPGDFALTVERGGVRLGLVGLNSAWMQLTGDADTPGGRGYERFLAVEPEQIATSVDLPEWARDHDTSLLLMHHPPEWMDSRRRKDFEQLVYDPARFAACLFGHCHAAGVQLVSGGGPKPRRWLQAPSLFGLEHWGGKHEQRASGFAWGRIVRTGPAAGRLEYAPFAAIARADNTLVVRPDPTQDPLADDVRLRELVVEERAGQRVAVVAVSAELGTHRRAVAERLRRTRGVGRVDEIRAESAADLEPMQGAAMRVVLVGWSTGGTELLEAALNPDREFAALLTRTAADLDAIEVDQIVAAKALRQRTGGEPAFDTEGEAATAALDRVDDWLQTLQPGAAGERAVPRDWERDYLVQRAELWARGGGNALTTASGGRTVERERQYVSLRALPDWCAEGEDGALVLREEGEPAGRPEDADPPDAEREAPEPPYLEAAISQSGARHLVVEGQAGTGKTVLLQHLAHVLGRYHREGELHDTPHELDLEALGRDRPLVPIPVLVGARPLADACDELAGGAAEAGLRSLARVLAGEMEEATGRPVDSGLVAEGLRSGRYLVLVDALDEVPGQERRQLVVSLLNAFAGGNAKSSVVLTTRPTADTGRLLFSDAFRTLRVAPLDAATWRALVRRWCDANGYPSTWRERLIAALDDIDRRDGAANLTENPMQLTAAMLVYEQQEELPNSLADLYDRIVHVLCIARRTPGLDADRKRQVLESVFLAMQEAGGTEYPLDEAVLRLVEAGRADDEATARLLVDHLSEDTALLRIEERRREDGSRSKVLRPWHRSFQEYLAASCANQSDASVPAQTDGLFEAREDRPARVDDPSWENVLRFHVGVYGSRGARRARSHVERLVDHAFGSGGAERHARPERALALAATGLAEYRRYFDGHPLVAELPGRLIQEFWRRGVEWSLRDRLMALDALGKLGDPRMDGDPWVELDGKGVVGGDERAFVSLPRRELDLGPYRLGWRPVTVGDYQRFVNDACYGRGDFWEDGPGERPERPASWPDQLLHRTCPVTGVSWFEARAFCRWVNAEGREAWSVPDGWSVGLPTEEEWELAARGKDASSFPWGKDEPKGGDDAQCNWRFSGSPGGPTPVGAFPRGNRGRLADLAGNAWEWTDSVGESSRVLRGGSWAPALRVPGQAPPIGPVPVRRLPLGVSSFPRARGLTVEPRPLSPSDAS